MVTKYNGGHLRKQAKYQSGAASLALIALAASAGLLFLLMISANPSGGASAQSSNTNSLLASQRPLSSRQRYSRELYWASRRGWQFGVPSHAYQSAMEQMRSIHPATARGGKIAEVVASVSSAPVFPGFASAWSFIGPEPILESSNFTGVVFGDQVAMTGRITAAAVDPNGVIVVGAASGGVWISSDGGNTFVPVFDSETTQAVGAIALDPTTQPTTIYVATGEGNNSLDSLYGQGIFKSTDLGKIWTQLAAGTFDHMSFTSLAIDTTKTPHVLFAGATSGLSASRADAVFFESEASEAGLWRSTDGGNTWTQYPSTTFGGCVVGTNFPCPADDVVIDPTNPNNVYAAIDGQNIYISHDEGITWTPATLPPTVSQGRQGLAVGPPASPGQPGVLYAMIGANDGSEYAGLHVSTDGGNTWDQGSIPTVPSFTQVGITIDGTSANNFSQSFYDMAIAVSPTQAGTVFFGGIGLYKSSNFGQTWTFLPQNGGVHANEHALALDPVSGQMLVGTDGGLFSFDPTVSGAATFNSLNATISATQVQGIGAHPADPTKLLASFQDNGTQIFSGGVATWNGPDSENGDGGVALWDQNDPLYLYHTFSVDSLGRPAISASTDGGATWCSAPLPAPSNCAAAGDQWSPNLQDQLNASGDFGPMFYPPLAVDPQVSHRVFFGAHGVYVSSDGMKTWQLQANQDLTDPNCFGSDCALEDLEFAPSDNTHAWAVAASSIDGSVPFAVSNTIQANLPNDAVWKYVTSNLNTVLATTGASVTATQATGIAVDPHNSQVAYLSLSGFSADTAVGHIYKTIDFGNTWTEADGWSSNGSVPGASPLPDVPVLKILVDNTDSSGTCGSPAAPCSNSIFAGTDIGVFHSSDGGNTWVPFNLGVIPAVPVYDMTQDAPGVIFAGTHGRGVYELPLKTTPTPTPTPSPTPAPMPTPTPVPTPVPFALSFQPTTLSFGPLVVGATAKPSKARTVTLTNPVGTARVRAPISIQGISTTDSHFQITGGTCAGGIQLAQGTHCTIQIVFTPTDTVIEKAKLQIIDNGRGSPITISMKGTAVLGTLSFSPSSLAFGKVAVGTASSTKMVKVKNTNAVPITIVKVIVAGTAAADFTPSSGCSSTLAANSNCLIGVTFMPSAKGARAAVLRIIAGANPNPIRVTLSGRGQ